MSSRSSSRSSASSASSVLSGSTAPRSIASILSKSSQASALSELKRLSGGRAPNVAGSARSGRTSSTNRSSSSRSSTSQYTTALQGLKDLFRGRLSRGLQSSNVVRTWDANLRLFQDPNRAGLGDLLEYMMSDLKRLPSDDQTEAAMGFMDTIISNRVEMRGQARARTTARSVRAPSARGRSIAGSVRRGRAMEFEEEEEEETDSDDELNSEIDAMTIADPKEIEEDSDDGDDRSLYIRGRPQTRSLRGPLSLRNVATLEKPAPVQSVFSGSSRSSKSSRAPSVVSHSSSARNGDTRIDKWMETMHGDAREAASRAGSRYSGRLGRSRPPTTVMGAKSGLRGVREERGGRRW